MSRWFVDRVPQRGIPSVSLRRLLPEARFVGHMDWEISGCCDDHRRLEPGQLFVAVPEARPGYDGHRYVREALDRGAAGVVLEHPCPEAGRLQVVVSDARAAHARICQALSGDPSDHLVTLGVTGTHGQTITAILVRSILDAAGERFGLIGSSGFCDGTKTRALGAGFSPPRGSLGAGTASSAPVGARQRSSRAGRIRTRGGRSRGPARRTSGLRLQGRSHRSLAAPSLRNRSLEGIAFDAAVVTDVAGIGVSPQDDLVQDRRARSKLFRQVNAAGLAVVNADDPDAEMLGESTSTCAGSPLRFEPVMNPAAAVDVSARLEWLDGSGTRMLLHGFDREVAVHLPLIGSRAASCALAAAALAWGLGIDRPRSLPGSRRSRSSPGISRASLRGRTSMSGSTRPRRRRALVRPWQPCEPSLPAASTVS